MFIRFTDIKGIGKHGFPVRTPTACFPAARCHERTVVHVRATQCISADALACCLVRRSECSKELFLLPIVNIVTCMKCDYRRGFGLMTGFIELFDTQREYGLHFNVKHILVSTSTSTLPFLGGGF
jgi:hypothetical protein